MTTNETDYLSPLTAMVCSAKGEPASSLSPRQAAEEFARVHWAEPRMITGYLLGTEPLSGEFQVVNETAFYRVVWDHDNNVYAITRYGTKAKAIQAAQNDTADGE